MFKHKESFGGADDVNLVIFLVIQEVNVSILSFNKSFYENAHKVAVKQGNQILVQKKATSQNRQIIQGPFVGRYPLAVKTIETFKARKQLLFLGCSTFHSR